jgi:dnd system-associated protein 4
LLSVTETKDIQVLGNDDIADEQRIHIFEEYANGGLEIIQNELRGAVDYSERLLLILIAERFKIEQQEEEFDLSRFLS